MLSEFDGKRVDILLKNKSTIAGTLKAYDMHLNMWLDDAEEQTEDAKTKLGTILLRGDSVSNVREAK